MATNNNGVRYKIQIEKERKGKEDTDRVAALSLGLLFVEEREEEKRRDVVTFRVLS